MKHRAKNINTRRWVEGELTIMEKFYDERNLSVIIVDFDKPTARPVIVDKDTVTASTGFKVDDNDLYEGDIVIYNTAFTILKGQVTYDEIGMLFVLDLEDGSSLELTDHVVSKISEINSNIFDVGEFLGVDYHTK